MIKLTGEDIDVGELVAMAQRLCIIIGTIFSSVCSMYKTYVYA